MTTTNAVSSILDSNHEARRAVLRRTYPEQFQDRTFDYFGSTSAYAGHHFLESKLHRYDGLFDHFGTDREGRLVTEPYFDRKDIEPVAREFASKHKLSFSIEPVPFHHPETTRVVFWPLPEWNLDLRLGRVRKACAEQGGFGMVIVGATQDKDARDEQ